MPPSGSCARGGGTPSSAPAPPAGPVGGPSRSTRRARRGTGGPASDRDAVQRTRLLLVTGRGGGRGALTGKEAQRRLGGEGVLVAGEGTGANLGAERLGRTAEHPVPVGETLHELRLEVGVEAEEVVADQHLTVALDARADADGGDAER